MSKFFSFFVTGLLFSANAFAQIEEISLRWNPIGCEEECARLMGESLQRLPGAEQVTVNQRGGEANLKWKKNVPFSFVEMNTAVRSVGLSVREFWFRVQGRVQEVPARFTNQPQMTLFSEGDNTPFILVGPTAPQQDEYTIQSSLETRPLPKGLQQQLLAAKNSNKLVTVQGPLLQPARYMTTMYLIVDNAQVEEKEQ